MVKRTLVSLLEPLRRRLERHQARLGLITYLDDPAGAPAPAASPAAPAPEPVSTLMGSDPPAPSPAPSPGAAPAPSPAPAPGAAPAPTPAPSAAPAPAEAKAPEEYTDFAVPEGVTFDAEQLGTFKTVAKEIGLTQEAAQKLVSAQAEATKKGLAAAQQRLEKHFADIGGTPDKWPDQCRADKEFGGEKFDENRAIAAKARDQFGTPALKQVLAKLSVGDHPELLRFMYRVGQALSEDTLVAGRGGAGLKSDAEVFYGTPKQ